VSRTISSSYSSGITLTSAGDNPVTVTGTINYSSTSPLGAALYSDAAVAWTITNSGRIIAGNYGVKLKADGGSVTNLSGGTITSSGYEAVYIAGALGTVANSGSIAASHVNANGIFMEGGTVTNYGGGRITGAQAGISMENNPGTVINSATITGSAKYGVLLFNGGSVTNSSGGTITGLRTGVEIESESGTVTNAGTIGGQNYYGVYLAAGSTLTNQGGGTISGSADAVLFRAGAANLLVVDPGAIFNGKVDGGNTIGAANVSTLELASGATAGTLTGLGSNYVNFANITVDASATWTLASVALGAGYTVYDKGALTNTGSIGSTVTLGVGAVLTNAAGATITGFYGVSSDGKVVNDGSIGGNTAAGFGVSQSSSASLTNQVNGTITGVYAVESTGAETSVNYGYIAGSQGGLAMQGGLLSNAATGTITSSVGVAVNSEAVSSAAAGTVLNAGTIAGSTRGVFLQHGGFVSNTGTGHISASKYSAVYFVSYAGTVFNASTIESTSTNDAAIYLQAGGQVTNATGGLVEGAVGGVKIVGGTLVSAGEIEATASGANAVYLASGQTERLVIDPGATFVGLVNGGNAIGAGSTSTLELASSASTGTLNGLGSSYTNFAQITVDSNASWTLTGTNTLQTGGTITNNGTLSLTSASFADAGALVNNGVILVDPSTLTAASLTGAGSSTIGASGTLIAQGTVSSGETIDFGGANSVLQISNAAAFAGTIAGAGVNNTIDLTGLTYTVGATGTVTGGMLTITSGANSATLAVAGIADNTPVTVTHDAGIGTEAMLCFLADTHIATPLGEVAVQQLTVGDAVVTASGATPRITWIGTGRVLATRGQRGPATPVIVRKGALADNVPHRDLRVTKGHSLFLDGALIPVEFLVNHRSIVWDDRAQEVTIYHIELETHDVLLAEGAPAESYRDDGNRWLFHNANAGWNAEPREPCAPVLTGGPLVDALWQRLLERAGPRPGVPLTDDPDLHLLVDGQRVDGRPQPNGALRFRLPKPASTVCVASRAGAPEELGLARDPRLLGVALQRIIVSQGRRMKIVEAHDPLLSVGFHLFEPDNGFRWTDGGAQLPTTLFDGLDGICELELHVACTTQYPVFEAPTRAAAA
jgi:Hint domain